MEITDSGLPPPSCVLIAGGGFVGAELARQLQALGSTALLLVRTQASAESLQQSGLPALALDLGDPVAVAALPERIRSTGVIDSQDGSQRIGAIVACASTRGGDEAAYRHLYLRGTRDLLATYPAARFLFTSSTSVYAQMDGSVVTEISETAPKRPTGRILLEAEQLVLNAGGIVLRLGGLYGAERWSARERVLEGTAHLGSDQHHYLNLIHRNDAVSALILLLRTPAASGIYNATDGTPITRQQLYSTLAEFYGKPTPSIIPEAPARRRGSSHKQVQSQRLTALGWSPTFPQIGVALESGK